jgi:hypothetical protein
VREVWVRIYVPEIICRFFVRILLFYRRLRYGFPFRKIPLTQGQFAIVDEDDFEKLAGYKWFAAKNGRNFYAERTVKRKDGRRGQVNIQMHRKILNAPKGVLVDHINHNGLDNRRVNLRVVTAGQNSWNVRKRRGCSSEYKGVHLQKRDGKWLSNIIYRGERFYLGCFDDEQSAARAYDDKAKQLFKDYAVLNFPDVEPPRPKGMK